MKNILGLVQSAPCRIDVTFRDASGAEYTKTAVVKGKGVETEELPLYTNHDGVFGEVGAAARQTGGVRGRGGPTAACTEAAARSGARNALQHTATNTPPGAHHAADHEARGALWRQGAAHRPDRAGVGARQLPRLHIAGWGGGAGFGGWGGVRGLPSVCGALVWLTGWAQLGQGRGSSGRSGLPRSAAESHCTAPHRPHPQPPPPITTQSASWRPPATSRPSPSAPSPLSSKTSRWRTTRTAGCRSGAGEGLWGRLWGGEAAVAKRGRGRRERAVARDKWSKKEQQGVGVVLSARITHPPTHLPPHPQQKGTSCA
jgi:hypothetical protein